jgi:excisionase family DNA binding protein
MKSDEIARFLNMNQAIENQAEKVPEVEALMTPAQVAAFLNMPLATLQSWRAQRTGPRGYRVGRHVRYRREDVETWLATRSDGQR